MQRVPPAPRAQGPAVQVDRVGLEARVRSFSPTWTPLLFLSWKVPQRWALQPGVILDPPHPRLLLPAPLHGHQHPWAFYAPLVHARLLLATCVSPDSAERSLPGPRLQQLPRLHDIRVMGGRRVGEVGAAWGAVPHRAAVGSPLGMCAGMWGPGWMARVLGSCHQGGQSWWPTAGNATLLRPLPVPPEALLSLPSVVLARLGLAVLCGALNERGQIFCSRFCPISMFLSGVRLMPVTLQGDPVRQQVLLCRQGAFGLFPVGAAVGLWSCPCPCPCPCVHRLWVAGLP